MRLLFAIVHYYKAGDGRHGHSRCPGPMSLCVNQLHCLYANPLDC